MANEELAEMELCYKRIPRNFKQMFSLAGHKCSCCEKHITFNSILKHNSKDEEEFINRILGFTNRDGDLEKLKTGILKSRRESERLVERMLAYMNAILLQGA
jgi:hypothetical protein